MRSRKTLLLAILYLLLSHIGYASVNDRTEELIFKNINSTSGLSHNTVQAIFQDSEGYMWFGTKDGLCRYDGYDWRIWRESSNKKAISNSKIRCITEDDNGYIWAGTDNGLNRIGVKDRSILSFISGPDTLLAGNRINDLLYDPVRNMLWIATDKGVSRYDTKGQQFAGPIILHNYHINALCTDKAKSGVYIGTDDGLFRYDIPSRSIASYHHSLTSRLDVLSIWCEESGEVWIGSNRGLLSKLNAESDEIKVIPWHQTFVGDECSVVSITESDGILWLITKRNGIFLYDRQNNTFSSTGLNPVDNDSSEKIILTHAYKDRTGDIWVGSYYKGVFLHSPDLYSFNHTTIERAGKQQVGVIGNIVSHAQKIWIGDSDNGITAFDPQNNRQAYFPLVERGAPLPECKPLLIHNGHLWVGTESNGIRVIEPESGKVLLRYTTQEGTLPSNRVNCAFEDSSGHLWIGLNGGPGGVCLLDEDAQIFVPHYPIESNHHIRDVYTIAEISYGLLWLGTRHGGLFSYEPEKELFCPIPINSRKDLSISSIFVDKKGRVWIGTFGQGLFCMDIGGTTSQTYDFSERGLGNNICSITEDENGRIWVSTFHGVAYFNENIESFVDFTAEKGFPISHVKPGSCLLYKGALYFGGENGLVSFSPDALARSSTTVPKIVLTDVLVHGHSKETSIDEATMPYTLELDHTENNITLCYAALDYAYPERSRYRYILKGIDERWREDVTERRVTYGNLPPGKYTFLVSSSVDDGIWSTPTELLSINIHPALWATWWAYLLYSLLLLSIIFLFLHFIISRAHIERDMALKDIEEENLKKMHRFRLDLFTSFSHEIRTPLTLVSCSVDELLSNSNSTDKTSLTDIKRNVDIMKELVNQLLDIRRYDSGQLKLEATYGDIILLINDTISTFSELSKIRNHPLKLEVSDNIPGLWFNPHLMEKVLYNVIMNAFKYSYDESTITISVDKIDSEGCIYRDHIQVNASEAVVISVFNNCEAIPPEHLEEIFKPFYRLDRTERDSSEGSGLGLSFNRMAMRLHHGDIWAENTTTGVVFRILLVVGKEFLSEDELSQETVVPDIDMPVTLADEPSRLQRYTILIVEDNAEIRSYLHDKLSTIFNVIDCSNGAEALKLLDSEDVDIIVSDVMMPVMSGIELCHALKSNVALCHIPILLLTAYASEDNAKEGFSVGADDYVAKPFNFDLLITRIKALLDNRERLKKAYRSLINPEDMNVSVPDYDALFLQKCYSFLQTHITDSNITIEDFGHELGMSRTQLYRKIKQLTSLSPSRFILGIRLKIAAELLQNETTTVSDICYRVGFSSLSYFTRCFREQYGMSPSDYRKNKTSAS